MRDASPQAIRLADYTPPAFLVSHVELEVDIREGAATVRSTLKLARNPVHPGKPGPLVLDRQHPFDTTGDVLSRQRPGR